MTKIQLHKEVTTILANYEEQFKSKKQFDLFKSELESIIKPKAGGGVTQYPMLIENDTNYHRCRYTELYLPESEMVMSNGKSKGYSKLAIAKWTKAGKEIQSINDKAMKLLLAGDVENGTRLAQEAEALKLDRNKPTYYSDVIEQLEDLSLEVK